MFLWWQHLMAQRMIAAIIAVIGPTRMDYEHAIKAVHAANRFYKILDTEKVNEQHGSRSL